MAGRKVIVTGAAGGLGKRMVERFAAQGDHVAVVGRTTRGLDEIVAGIEKEGGRAFGLACDLAKPDEIERMVTDAAERMGGIDVLVNNAAYYKLRPWTEKTIEEWDMTLAVNLRGCFLTARAAHEHLKASGSGRIINIASNTFFLGWPGLLDYTASKGGMVGFTRTLAREVGAERITVNIVSPGAIPTAAEDHYDDQDEMNRKVLDAQAVKRRGTPDDIATAVLFVAGEDTGFITGQILEVDGGWALN